MAAAEAPPPPLARVADLVTVRFPWGSLLRGCVGLDAAVAAGVAGLVAPRGTLELLLAPSARDGLEDVPTEVDGTVTAAVATFEPFGFGPEVGRAATAEEIAASGSTWAKRLAAGHNGDTGRAVTLLRLVRRGR